MAVSAGESRIGVDQLSWDFFPDGHCGAVHGLRDILQHLLLCSFFFKC